MTAHGLVLSFIACFILLVIAPLLSEHALQPSLIASPYRWRARLGLCGVWTKNPQTVLLNINKINYC